MWIKFVDFIYMKILDLPSQTILRNPTATRCLDLFTFSIAIKIHLLSGMHQTFFSLQMYRPVVPYGFLYNICTSLTENLLGPLLINVHFSH